MHNLKLVINANGYGAYGKININKLIKRIKAFDWQVESVNGHNLDELKKRLRKNYKANKPTALVAITSVSQFSFLKDIHAHYKVMSDKDLEVALRLLN